MINLLTCSILTVSFLWGIMTSEQINAIENKLNYTFSDKRLLITAFTHSSYANAQCYVVGDNGRMAFLGDAILDMIVSKYLYKTFPDSDNGDMSYMRSDLVSRNGLAPIVDKLKIEDCLQVVANSKLSAHALGDLFEAIVCAIYLDGGFVSAEKFVLNLFSDAFSSLHKSKQKDSKTLLQEYCQSLKPRKTVAYVQSGRSGTDNNPIYRYDLLIDNVYMCSGEGPSKKSAEQDAAKKLVTKWRID